MKNARLERLNLFQILQKLIDSKRPKRKTTQETLNYNRMYANGVCHVAEKTYNKMIRFSDISYQLSQDDVKQRIFAQYSTLLNSFDDTIKIQFCFINYRMNVEQDEEVISYSKNMVDVADFEILREEYFSFLEEQRQKGNKGIIRNKYLVFSIKDDSYDNAVRRLESIEDNIKDHFRAIDVVTEGLDGIERLSVINYLLNSSSKHYIELENLSKEQLRNGTTKDLIAPKSVDFETSKDEFKVNNKYAATLHLKIEATELSDRALADFLYLDFEMLVSLHIRSLGQQQAVRMVKSKASDLDSIKIEEQKKALRSGYDMDILPTDLNTHVEESKKILKDLQKENEKYFFLTFTITVFENTQRSLDNAIFRLSSIAQKHNCTLKKLKLQQEKALISALPLGENLNETELERGLTTSSTAIFVPFTTQELHQEKNDPVYYGLNALSNNMIQVSRKSLKNPNGLFLGTPGSGKSFASKREMIDTLLRTLDDVLISDPEDEYSPFVIRFGGKVINLSISSKDHINPLDISLQYGEGANPISFKSDFIISMMELIAGGKDGLTARQKTITDKCVRVIYRPFLENPIKENIPILEDLYKAFIDTGKPEGQELADALELYVHGSLNVFNHRTSIDVNNRLISFNIKELGSNLRELGMLVLQDHVWNKVTINRNKNKKTWYYMDEFHKLLAEEQTANYSVEFWKRFRKWGGIPTGMTQNVKDLLLSPKIETIIDNTDFVYLLNQATSDRTILQKRFGISDYQANYVTNSDEGEGLIVYSGIILPFKDKFPKNNSLYPVMTTKPDEIKSLRTNG
ncbi:VirB4-like conjugal transfer ATPase, CD1110 family [Priestia megaterium]|uniref:VirB4-like conjugal transfer ATPase, CD1110 family n=1 Tax=Priestia megaterium TaxID=1404 RepID=UPI001A93D2D4|nr:conjugal transfer protein TraE [Priestia megaterium]QSX24470.1 conjugal transfer protein TraE [Priestia megaterium]